MATLRQVLANRLNASKSTGPVSSEGKAIVARNAVKHAVFSENLLAEGDDPAELEEFCGALLAEIAPQTPSQRICAERIISASWRLKRLSAAEQHQHRTIGDCERFELGEGSWSKDEVGYPGQAEDVAQAAKAREGSREQDRREKQIDQRRREWADQQICPAGLTLAIDLEADASIIGDRYSRYEKRLEGTIHRAWRELRLLRKDAEGHTPSPLEGEGGGEGEAVQTPATVPPPRTDAESAPRETTPSESARPTPHPSPLPQGERERCNASSIAIVQNKPNPPASDAPAEVYGEAKALPLPRVILRALPGQFLDDLLDRK